MFFSFLMPRGQTRKYLPTSGQKVRGEGVKLNGVGLTLVLLRYMYSGGHMQCMHT